MENLIKCNACHHIFDEDDPKVEKQVAIDFEDYGDQKLERKTIIAWHCPECGSVDNDEYREEEMSKESIPNYLQTLADIAELECGERPIVSYTCMPDGDWIQLVFSDQPLIQYPHPHDTITARDRLEELVERAAKRIKGERKNG